MLYPMKRTRIFLQRPTVLGVATALMFVCGSLVPGLLPLSWVVQGLVSGMWMAIGYGLGTGVSALAGTLVRRRPSSSVQRGAWITLVVVGESLTGWSLFAHYQWQVDVRRLMGMRTAILHYPVAIPCMALLVAVLLVLSARVVRATYRQYINLVSRYLPRAGAHVVGVLTTVFLVVVFADKVVGEQIFPALNHRYIAADAGNDTTIQPPMSPYKAGGAASRIAWETLGQYGRAFITDGPEVAELTTFSGMAAMEPIRIYVGRQSAPSAAQRAALAVAELERTGAFRRQLLVIVIPTGTGWVDPYAVAPLEYMYNGNTAAVAMQYSYLPSWIVMLGKQDVAKEAAHALIAAVEDRLEREPAATRPRLVVYGQSLGAFGAEAAFTGLDDITRRTDGVLWVGPFSDSRLWRQFTTQRNPGSPIWQPVYQDGATVRFGGDRQSLLAPTAPWHRPHVVYLQHASDPITWWSPAMLVQRPAWLEEPRGPDVSEHLRYYPIATCLRVAIDVMVGLGVPPGHGHRYGVAQAEAWTLIIPPDDWAEQDTQRLITVMKER